jgi:hypothetical protein
MTLANAIQQSSFLAIQTAMHRLQLNNFANGRWLGKRNRYALDTLERIKSDLPSPLHLSPAKRPLQISEYLAASVVLHNLDGWSD